MVGGEDIPENFWNSTVEATADGRSMTNLATLPFRTQRVHCQVQINHTHVLLAGGFMFTLAVGFEYDRYELLKYLVVNGQNYFN